LTPLLIGVPMLGNAAPDHGPVTHQAQLPAGWVFDVASGTGQSTSMVKALVLPAGPMTDGSMVAVRLDSALRAGTEPAVAANSIDALVDEYATRISARDAALIRKLAGSMSSAKGAPTRNSIYDAY
jgi:hypothetical protein